MESQASSKSVKLAESTRTRTTTPGSFTLKEVAIYKFAENELIDAIYEQDEIQKIIVAQRRNIESLNKKISILESSKSLKSDQNHSTKKKLEETTLAWKKTSRELKTLSKKRMSDTVQQIEELRMQVV
jgi:hypothetical protein